MAGRTANAARNIFWGSISTIVSIALPFLSRSVLIYAMGVDYVGLSSLFTSILQVLSFTELGLGSALVYSMYDPIAHGDEEKVCALLNFYKKSYRIIGLVILVLGLALAPFLNNLIEGDVPSDISIHSLFIIYLANNVVGYFVFAEKSSLLLACQRDDLNSRVGLVLKAALHLIQVAIILIFKNYYLYALCNPVCSFASNVLTDRIARKKYPQFYCKGEIGREELGKIKKNVGGMVFQKIGGVVLSSVDTIVISMFLGLAMVGIFNNYYYIFVSLNTFLGMITRALIPSVGNSIACNSREKNYKDFRKIYMMYDWIVVWWSASMLCLIQPFMRLWVGEELMLSDTMGILFAAYFLFFKWMDVIHVYREASGIWWEGKWFPLIAAGLNLFLNIFLVQKIGLAGVLLSTIACLLLVHDTVGVYVLKRYYFKEVMSLKRFYLNQAYILLTAVLVCAICYLICGWFEMGTIATLVLRFSICMVVPNICLLFFWERYQIVDDIKAILKKVK